MDFNIKTGQPEKQRADCLILGVFEDSKLPQATDLVDIASGGYLRKIIKSGDIDGKAGQTLLLLNVPHLVGERVLLIGCGKQSEFNPKGFKDAVNAMANDLKNRKFKEVICCLTDLSLENYDISWKTQHTLLALGAAFYKFDEYKSKDPKTKITPPALKTLTFLVANKRDLVKGEQGIKIGVALNSSIALTKDLANTPPNICNPEYLAKAAQKVGKSYKSLSVAVLERKELQNLKMGALLAVGQGSVHPPRLITIEYRGAAKTQQPVVLVGKGITFDTGGNSLKPADRMIGMKFDMTGAATVLGMLKFAAEMQLPLNMVGVMAIAENMPGSTASRPDDVVTTMAGITVEILNTDAEGRLILADALTYTERFNPKVVIDIATLTGACVAALGFHHSGMFTNHQPLGDDLLRAGIVSGDKCWQLPLTDEYVRQLDSNVADVANIGGPEAGAITAACFLSKFTKKYNWAHLDVAGTACKFVGKDRGATGQPMPLLAEYLMQIR